MVDVKQRSINYKALAVRLAFLLVASFAWQVAQAIPEYNLPVGVTTKSKEIYDLHMLIFWVCVVLSVLVYGVMFYAMVAYRKSANPVAATFTDNHRLEWGWTIGAALILVLLAIPSTRVLFDIYTDEDIELNIKVTGYQWKWRYEYLSDDYQREFSFFSNLRTPDDEITGAAQKGEHYLLDVDNPVYIPIDTKVRFLITANDVLHAFWVRDFGIKQDAIPGYINTAWVEVTEPGVYRGVCAELCGLDHGFMPIVVVAVKPDEYKAWRQEQLEQAAAERELFEKEWTREELMVRGENVYQKNCVACHQADGTGVAGAFPALRGSEIVLGSLAGQVEVVQNGVTGTAMQAFGSQLSPVDLAAVITYTRFAWGNDAGGDGNFPVPKDFVTPAQ